MGRADLHIFPQTSLACPWQGPWHLLFLLSTLFHQILAQFVPSLRFCLCSNITSYESFDYQSLAFSDLCTRACSVAQSSLTLCDPMDCSPTGSSLLGNFPGKNTGGNYHFPLQGIFLTQGSNPCLSCLLHWQVDSLPLSYRGSPLWPVSCIYCLHSANQQFSLPSYALDLFVIHLFN